MPSFVQRHFGDEVLEKIGAPLLRGVFGGDVTKLSVRAVMAPFVAMEREHGSLIAAMQARAAAKEDSEAPIFTTLRSGLGTLVDRMVAAIPEDWIRLGTTVHSISRNQRRLERSGRRNAEETFDALLMAAPVHVAQNAAAADRCTSRRSHGDGRKLCGRRRLWISRCRTDLSTPPGFGFLVPQGSGSLLLACTFVDQKFADRVPPNGKLVRAFFGGDAAERADALRKR